MQTGFVKMWITSERDCLLTAWIQKINSSMKIFINVDSFCSYFLLLYYIAFDNNFNDRKYLKKQGWDDSCHILGTLPMMKLLEDKWQFTNFSQNYKKSEKFLILEEDIKSHHGSIKNLSMFYDI